MVTRIILLTILLASFAAADCTTDWVCDDWSDCSIVGYMTRNCQDNNNCGGQNPQEIKKCDDDAAYEPENEVIADVPEPEIISEDEEPQAEADEQSQMPIVDGKPNLWIGLGIIALFIIIGIIIGRIIKIRK